MKSDDDKGTYLRVLVDKEMLRYLLRRSDRNGESMSKYVGRLIRLDMAAHSAEKFSEKNKKCPHGKSKLKENSKRNPYPVRAIHISPREKIC